MQHMGASMMLRYIVENTFLTASGDICTAEHGVTYKTLKKAAQGQFDHMNNSEYLSCGFRIIELEEVKKT